MFTLKCLNEFFKVCFILLMEGTLSNPLFQGHSCPDQAVTNCKLSQLRINEILPDMFLLLHIKNSGILDFF